MPMAWPVKSLFRVASVLHVALMGGVVPTPFPPFPSSLLLNKGNRCGVAKAWKPLLCDESSWCACWMPALCCTLHCGLAFGGECGSHQSQRETRELLRSAGHSAVHKACKAGRVAIKVFSLILPQRSARGLGLFCFTTIVNDLMWGAG